MTGDAMARPLIEEYERKAATGTPYDGSSLFAISSSAAIFSPDVKKRWMDVFPNAIFTDSVGATETGFQGMGMQDKDQKISTDGPVVGLGPDSVVLDDDNRLLDPATDIGKIGRLGRGGNVPVGYYKDPEKSAATFLEIDGAALLGARRLRPDRGGQPGHAARPRLQLRQHRRGEGLPRGGGDGGQGAPGRLRLPRGRHPRREVRPGRRRRRRAPRGRRRSSSRSCATSCAQHLSGYKLPRSLTVVPQIPRNATGKAQYPAAKEMALAHVAV